MEQPGIKEERISDDEDVSNVGGGEEERKLFLADPIKIEYLADPDEYKCSLGFASADLFRKEDVTEDEHSCAIKQEKVEEDRAWESFEGHAGSAPSTSRCVISSLQRNSIEGAFDVASSNEDVIRTHGKCVTAAGYKRHIENSSTRNRLECDPANIGKLLSNCAVSSGHSLESESKKQSQNVCRDEQSRDLIRTKTYDQNGRFECADCKQRFRRRTHLNEHTRTHAGVKPFECEDCQRKFSLKRYLKAHRKIHSGDREKTFECEECKQKFSSKTHLNDHVRIHTGEKPFHCGLCDDKFSQKSNLKAHHQRVHAKLFECHECKQKFVEMSHLSDHMRVHTGEKPFKCEQCGETFSRRFTLRYHQRTHGIEKPFQCEQCHRTFVRKCLLKSHQREHT